MSDYYTSQSAKMVRRFSFMLRLMRKPIVEKYGKEKARMIHKETLAEFERLIPAIPYLGGFYQSYTQNLVQTAGCLALYRVIQRQGGTVGDAAEIVHRGLIRMLDSIPRFIRHWRGKQYKTSEVRKSRQLAAQTQKRQYPGDWVVEFVEGDGQAFDWGLDMHECGIEKFLKAHDANELGPYMCAIDYIMLGAFGLELRRSKILIHGCDKCDFRFVVDGDPSPYAWPPRFPEENCGL